MSELPAPTPLFDAMEFIESQRDAANPDDGDYFHGIKFLCSYQGSQGTFNSYRREVERLIHWSHLIAKKNINQLKRDDLEAFMRFCQRPFQSWIGIKKAPKFIESGGERKPNPEWRPFVVTISKSDHKKGLKPSPEKYQLSQSAIKESFAILSSFYNYLIQEEVAFMNPVALIRQKSKFIRKQQGGTKIRRLSDLQWQTVINTALKLAEKNPNRHERTLFIMSCLYSMYLRISELAASPRWEPCMNDFHRDHDGLWWFTTVGKGNKERQVAVSDAMLESLKRWRKYLGLSTLPTAADNSPLLPKIRGNGPINSTHYLREIVQHCFDCAIEELKKDKFTEDAENLMEATVHWLRHTGISDDVKHRPREHVRDDAGHSSSAITDKYIDVELRARHESAKHKPINDAEL